MAVDLIFSERLCSVHWRIRGLYYDFDSSWAISNPRRWYCGSDALIISGNLKISAVAQLETVSFHSNFKERQCQQMLKYHAVAITSHANKVLLKIPQARLQQYINCELPDVQACFTKYRGTRDQIPHICWIFEKASKFQENNYFCKSLWLLDQNKLLKILKEMGIPHHETYLLRSLYAGQEATVSTGHWITDWFQIGKGVHQGCILSPCLFNFYAEKCWSGINTNWNQDCQEKC